MKKKRLLAAFLLVVSTICAVPVTSHADQSTTSGDVTIYYTRNEISARVDNQNADQCHYDYKINSVSITDQDGNVRSVGEDSVVYVESNVTYNGKSTHVHKTPIPVDTSRHKIASVPLNSGEHISGVNVSTWRTNCTFNDKRTTCTQKRCVYCNKNYIVEAEHNWEWVTDIKPRCEKEGKKHEKCTVCGAKRNMDTPIDALGHDWRPATLSQNRGIKKAPTYNSNGEYYKTCSRCSAKDENEYNEVLSTGKTCKHVMYPDRAESYYDWIVEKEATKKEPGLKYQVCRICGDRKNDTVIPAGMKSGSGASVVSMYPKVKEPEAPVEKVQEVSDIKKDAKANALKIEPNKVMVDAQTTAEQPLVPFWGIIVIGGLAFVGGSLAAWEFLLRDYFENKKKNKESSREEY